MAILSLRDILLLCFCVLIHFIYRNRRRAVIPYPPGLRRWPIIGSALSMPLTYVHVFYKNLGDKLGTKIIYTEAFGQEMIFLNDARIAKELLEKRSGLYSSRPEFPMVAEIVDAGIFFGFVPYGDSWRHQRRIFTQYFSLKNQSLVEEKATQFVRKCLLSNIYQNPQDLDEHIRDCMGGFSTSLTYGLPTKRHKDPLVLFAEDVFTRVVAASTPGNFLVNIFPVLKHIPEWMPGAGFKREARDLRKEVHRFMVEPFQAAQKSMGGGTRPDCFVAESLERNQDRKEFELRTEDIQRVALQVYGAASETTVSATRAFVLAMLKYPDVQKKAQQELDSVLGLDGLPDFSDKPHLPYFGAVLKEVIRWNPVVPLGLPHYTVADDVYEGHYIPKGCTIWANAYAMLYDESIFPNPTEFSPERFFKNGVVTDDIPNPEELATFGFGRRICPGAHVALSMLYIAAASLLAVFDISPALDEKGDPIEVEAKFVAASLVSSPQRFKCKLTPRQGKNVGGILKDYINGEII
ncbi:cytochrome P450 [Macrolepiota fuliginosa MF-IS2]|uniref:Cytochrome P450 n=1 Tax=Macrolepiota fuliginosa MF-IS2 TaxID=1400762 RepID=A0A9P5X3Q4_9AGAR|nr:cytochrome P450 [Macrolepiota fuliginosa MF-IS2]